MKTQPLLKAARAGALDLTRELGLLVYRLDGLAELTPDQRQLLAEDLAAAREGLDAISLTAGRLSDQFAKAEKVLAKEQLANGGLAAPKRSVGGSV